MKFVPLATAFFVGLVAVILFADMGRLGPLQVIYSFKHGDKAMHFLLLGTLALLVDLALMQAVQVPNPRLLAIAGSAVILALSSFEEFSQLWVPVRSPDWYDLLASYAGIVFGTFLALALADYVRASKRAPGNTA